MPEPRAPFRQAGRAVTGRAAISALMLGVLLLFATPAAASPEPTPPLETVYGRTGANPGQLGDGGSPLGVPSPSGASDTSPSGTSNRTRLPTTGLDVGGAVTLGTAMVIAGVLMLTVRRRGPRSTLATLPPDDDYTWHAPTQELPVWHRAPSD